MIFTQFVDDALGCASYLVGDPGTGQAVVVDPAFAIEQYLEEAEKRDVRIVRVIETHTHADHLAGHGRFALEHGTPISVHPAAERRSSRTSRSRTATRSCSETSSCAASTRPATGPSTAASP